MSWYISEKIESNVVPLILIVNRIHESCPHCGKVMLQDESMSIGRSTSDAFPTSISNARRICKSCRRRVGLCFLCHEPVKGVYVWCPGCGTFVVVRLI